jgi:6-bladed beta-propeller protein
MSTTTRHNAGPGRLIAIGLIFLPLLLVGLAQGQDAVVSIDNPATPTGGIVKIEPTELWRVGGDDDEIFFGSVGAIRLGTDGNIYVLDGQLAEAHVYSPTGEHLQTLGGEGDGPGEFRAPGDLFIAGDGNICVLQGFPGKIVELTADGLPAGVNSYSVGEGNPGQFTVLIRGLADGPGLLLAGIRMSFGGGGQSNQTYFLDRCDRQGKQIGALAEKEVNINYGDLEMNEGASDFPWSRMGVGADGKIFVGIPRNEYAISVFSPEGKLEKVIRRSYESRVRTEDEKQIARRIQRGIGANYPTPVKRVVVEDTLADIGQLHVMADGRLWIETSIGNRDVPEGCWMVLDVFSPEGVFEKQVALVGDHDGTRDGLTLLADGRCVVVTGALDAWLNQMGAVDENVDESEAHTLEVICYQLEDK